MDSRCIQSAHQPAGADLSHLPAPTIVAAENDPLRPEARMLADMLKAAQVRLNYRLFNGVTHEFFGMDPGVAKVGRGQN